MATKRVLLEKLKELGVYARPQWRKTILQEKLAQAKARITPEVKEEVKEPEERIRPETETQNTVETAQEPEDYLRKWQVRKDTAYGSKESDPQLGSRAAVMKETLLKQPKVRIIIPRAPKEDPSILQSVQLNDYRLDLPKQKYIEVPRQVAEVIMESQAQTDAALATGQIDYEAKKEGVSYADALL